MVNALLIVATGCVIAVIIGILIGTPVLYILVVAGVGIGASTAGGFLLSYKHRHNRSSQGRIE